MPTKQGSRNCIYCGKPIRKVKKGEHIVPAAIGGVPTIKTVCGDCNNNVLSRLDTELCSRSPLSIIASRELDAHLWQVWDVDHSERNLLVEAHPDWSAKNVVLYPQIVFEPRGIRVYGDQQDFLRFGEDVERVLVKTALKAFRRYEAGESRWLHFEHVDLRHQRTRGYRFPPRMFARHTIGELGAKLKSRTRTSFILRYLTKEERRYALNVLDNWDSDRTFGRREVARGSHMPVLASFFDGAMVLRGLFKIAVNLLAAYCINTRVNNDAFSRVIRVVMGQAPVTPQLFFAYGFVIARDIQTIRVDGAHSFRLLHMDGHWHVFFSFFGGNVGAFVRFPGPNGESWRCADVIAPIGSKHWEFRPLKLFYAPTVRIEWDDLSKIVPSLEILNAKSELRIERVPRRKK